MNKDKLEKILNPITFLIVNAAIILIVELSGQLFFQLGAIHMIALLFIALAVIRIFVHYYTYDPILEKFFNTSLIALFVFATSHIIEYLSMHTGAGMSNYYSDSVFVNTTNFYLISLMLIIIGAEAFLRIHDNRSALISKILFSLIGLLLILLITFTMNKDMVSLSLDNPTPYIYLFMVVFFGMVTINKIKKIGEYVKIASGFVSYLSISVILIVSATIPYIFYDLLTSFNIPLYQVMYFSHFFFYAALSLMFLAFGKVVVSKGLYDDLKEMEIKN